MSDREGSSQPEAVKMDLSEVEIAARFEATVRRMANTPPEPKPDKRAAPAIKTKKAPKASS